MNPLTNIKNINKLNDLEAEYGISAKQSWHQQYQDSAYIYIGGLPFDLTEGDILCVFSQYGEIVNINLVRDKKSGKSQGFCFIAYEDQRSTILAVDNLNGFKILGRTIRVDHVNEYRAPKENDNDSEELRNLHKHGCAPKLSSPAESDNDEKLSAVKKSKKGKAKKSKKVKKKKKKATSEYDSSEDSEDERQIEIKKEKIDTGYIRQEDSYRTKSAEKRHEQNKSRSKLIDDERRRERYTDKYRNTDVKEGRKSSKWDKDDQRGWERDDKEKGERGGGKQEAYIDGRHRSRSPHRRDYYHDDYSKKHSSSRRY